MPQRPGLKAIHLRTDERNPAAGSYPLKVAFVDAGPLSGAFEATAHIDAGAVPNIAQYNQLHEARNEDWQRTPPGQTAALPVDLLVTRTDLPRATLALSTRSDGSLSVLSDGKPIGTVAAHGVPVTLTPVALPPGFARLGIVRFQIRAGETVGTAEIEATLDGGTMTTVHAMVSNP
jgi:hypothetical protein